MATNPKTKTYKARIEHPVQDCHAMIVWFDAPNILSAAKYIHEKFGVLGVDEDNVTLLVEAKPNERME